MLFPEKVGGRLPRVHASDAGVVRSGAGAVARGERRPRALGRPPAGRGAAARHVGRDADRRVARPDPRPGRAGSRSTTAPTATNRYGMGAMLLDGETPPRCSPAPTRPLLIAEEPYEHDGFLHDVVFPSGHVDLGDGRDPRVLRRGGRVHLRGRPGDRRRAVVAHARLTCAETALAPDEPVPAAGPDALAVAVYEHPTGVVPPRSRGSRASHASTTPRGS